MHPLLRARDLLFEKDKPQAALELLRDYRRDAPLVVRAACLEMQALNHLGRTDEAADLAWHMVQPGLMRDFSWAELNTIVDTLNTAGRYEEALEIEQAVPQELREAALRRHDPAFGLVQLNLAESDMNVGRAEKALTRLDGWDVWLDGFPLVKSGLGMQRGWILGMLGRGRAAVSAVNGMSADALGKRYRAEYHLSRAFAFLAAKEPRNADAEVEEAMLVAVRPSSRRNAMFLKARVLHARGRIEEAEQWCRDAAHHPHRWQGGDGLLFWGDLLEVLGREADARQAWQLAIDRDGQSVWAKTARERLTAPAPPGSSAP